MPIKKEPNGTRKHPGRSRSSGTPEKLARHRTAREFPLVFPTHMEERNGGNMVCTFGPL
jgi:hypothetical protein